MGTTAYVATQTGGTVSILSLTLTGTTPTGTVTTVKAGMGMRSLAFDAKDSLLLGVSEAGGMVVLLNVPANTLAGTIKAVVSESGEGSDDHSDHDNAMNMPKLVSLSPATGRQNSTVSLVVNGTNLRGVTNIKFTSPTTQAIDSAFVVTNVNAANDGKQVTATVQISATAALGPRAVRILTQNGATMMNASGAVFTVIP